MRDITSQSPRCAETIQQCNTSVLYGVVGVVVSMHVGRRVQSPICKPPFQLRPLRPFEMLSFSGRKLWEEALHCSLQEGDARGRSDTGRRETGDGAQRRCTCFYLFELNRLSCSFRFSLFLPPYIPFCVRDYEYARRSPTRRSAFSRCPLPSHCSGSTSPRLL
jgi:hypothetical protein